VTFKDPEIGAVRELLAGMGGDGLAGPIDYPTRRAGMDAFGDMSPPPEGCAVEAVTLGGRPAEKLTPKGAAADKVLLYFHGGAYSLGSPKSHRGLAAHLAAGAGATAYVPDYRLAPEDPYPAAVEDGVAAYKALLDAGVAASRIVIGGDSAGGGLTLATALAARDAGLPAAAGLFLISPWANMTTAGASYAVKEGKDPMISTAGMVDSAATYLAGKPDDALASPAMADFTGLPPMLIHVGSEEVLMSDSVAVAQQAGLAGVGARLEIWPEMIHVWHAFYMMLGAGRRAIAEAGTWIGERLS
jgi:acetyl esterase/lipase